MLRCLFCDKGLGKIIVVWSFRSLLLKNYSWRLCFLAFPRSNVIFYFIYGNSSQDWKQGFFPPFLSLLSCFTFSSPTPSSLPLFPPSFLLFFHSLYVRVSSKCAWDASLYLRTGSNDWQRDLFDLILRKRLWRVCKWAGNNTNVVTETMSFAAKESSG